MIHCDEVFDILTRGPFPTGAPSDGIVESHLSHCDECRRLAEALRPAIELLQEAITDDEGRDLPRYWGNLSQPRAEGAGKLTATKTQPRRTFGRRTAPQPQTLPLPATNWNGAARLAAAVLLGVVLASLLRQASPSHQPALHQMAGRVKSAHWRLNERGEQWSAGQGLAAACRQPVSGLTLVAALTEPLAGTGEVSNTDEVHPSAEAGPAEERRPLAEAASRLACCLGCHSAKDHKLLASTAVSRLVQACGACHE